MASFFNVGALGGNPFSSPVGQRIEQATDASLASENWALNMEICDLINESSDTARDAMKAIRKRLTQNAGKNSTVIMYTLTVLETCVKNCGKAFHMLVANKEFINELVKLIGPKNDPPAIVQEKVLSLIQIWADAFKNQPDLNGVVQVYQELKNKGIEFPMTDLDSLAPIYTPQRSVPGSTSSSHQTTTSPQHGSGSAAAATQSGSPGVVNGPVSLSSEQISKLQNELDIVTMNMSILGEMLIELKPGQEDPADYKLLNDLTQTCREMQGRIVELIGRVNHDEITAELLRLNDELNNLFLRHQRYEKNRDPNSSTAAPSTILGAAMGVPVKNEKDQAKDSLIDLSDSGAAGGADGLTSKFTGLDIGTASSQLSKIDTVSAVSGSTSKTSNDADEFDILAQSRNVTGTSNEVHTSNKQPDLMKDAGPEESLTSTEFDKFLAERAAAAENLPTVTTVSGITSSSSPTTTTTTRTGVSSTTETTNLLSGGDTTSSSNRQKKPHSKKDEENLLSV